DGVANTPEKMSRYVGVALDKTATLERLIEGFFAYSRVELLEQPPQREPVDLGALLAGAVAAAGPRAQGRSLSLSLDEGPEPCTVNADAAMLTRVVDNLLENAIRYTPEGGAITVGWRSGIDHARFWVQDTGPGIPPDDLGRVFQPLYRGDKARGSRTGGSGLGLAIARRLVEAHGGTISVENDGGARFTVTLPIEKGRGA
ncbi:MAG TPA: HAMP domain-containing sensor histidine kinase, partial [Symbiobacteriaceae bacterium]|nr:HAMP domain-containing sensor histidine kinase [Symbiobacteriaceae bacterium]